MSINYCDFNYLRQLVHQYSSMVLDSDKSYLAELRLAPLATQMKFNSLGDLMTNLQSQPFNHLHIQVVEAMLLTETSFFRDRYPFEAIANHILPELLSHQQTERTLNIWCAACSSGQEPYSIAMLLGESLPQLANWKIQLLATDLSQGMIARARRGCYSQMEVTRGLAPDFLTKYFEQLGNEWQLKDRIRQMVNFRQLNLVTDSLATPIFDIIFLRNVLIYFDIETKKIVLEKVRQVLSPNGYLFLGGGETTLNLDDSFTRVQIGKAVCYRRR